MIKYSENEINEMLEESEYLRWCELFEDFDNDEVYEDYVNIENILKMEGF